MRIRLGLVPAAEAGLESQESAHSRLLTAAGHDRLPSERGRSPRITAFFLHSEDGMGRNRW